VNIRKKELRVFILISIILIIISVVSTIISWNFFHSETEVPVYDAEESIQGGKIEFGIILANKSEILNSPNLINENG